MKKNDQSICKNAIDKQNANNNQYKICKARARMKTLKEIRRYQISTKFLLRKLSFQRLIRQICLKSQISDANMMRFQSSAMIALQETVETWLIAMFECKWFVVIIAILLQFTLQFTLQFLWNFILYKLSFIDDLQTLIYVLFMSSASLYRLRICSLCFVLSREIFTILMITHLWSEHRWL